MGFECYGIQRTNCGHTLEKSLILERPGRWILNYVGVISRSLIRTIFPKVVRLAKQDIFRIKVDYKYNPYSPSYLRIRAQFHTQLLRARI